MAESGKLNSVENSSGDDVPGRKEEILCQPCSRKDLQTTADVFCLECDEFQCSECSNAHTVYAFMKNHKLVNATKVKSKSSSFDMKGMRSVMNKMFDELEVYVTRETDAFQAEVTNKLAKKRFSSEKHIDDITKSLEIVNTALQNGTPSQQFIVTQKIKEQMFEINRDVDNEFQKSEVVTVSFRFDERLKLPPLPISDYVPGKLTSNYTLPEANNSVTPVDPIVKLTKIASIKLKKARDDIGEPYYSGMDVLPDGRLVAVDNCNKKCLIYNEKLEKVGSFRLSYKPKSVAAVFGEEVAITSGDQYKIDFLRVSKSNEISLNRTCKVKTKYASICMKDERNFVVGTIDEARPVRIVSLSGEENDFSVIFPNKEYSLGASECNFIRNTEKMILTDRFEHTVYIYDVATNTRVIVKDAQIKEPRGVAVGPPDCILVCSKNTDSIVQISQTGRSLSSIKLNMDYPRSVCISKDKSILAVTNSCEGKMKL